MTVALMKTKAEQGLQQRFESDARGLPGTGWVAKLRSDAMASFNARGLPHRRIEEFKYTDLRERLKDIPPAAANTSRSVSKDDLDAALGPLATIACDRIVLIDGRFEAALSQLPVAATGIELFPLGQMLAKSPDWLSSKFTAERTGGDAIAALNLAFMTDGVMVKVKAGMAPERPVMIVSVVSSQAAASVTERNIVSVEAGAGMTLIEAHVALNGAASGAHRNVATDVDIAASGALRHIKCVATSGSPTHLSQWRVRIGKAATYRGFQMTAGTATARNEIHVAFTGPDAKLDVSGAFLGRGSDHIDTTLVVDHSTPGCESRELFKGVLDGRARGVFQGKIIVQPIAQKTDGKQMSQALMLSEEAEFDSKPELEIYADDVACGHGATAAELDPAMLFYLMSRGIPRPEARAMLIESFIGEAIDKIEDEALREAFMAIARVWLEAA
ncbi:MAG: Fe-S cluster assembly protein SufD [Hyphomicrobiaceae bacterium]